MTTLPSPTNAEAKATGINGEGDVVGHVWRNGTPLMDDRGVVWRGGRMHPIRLDPSSIIHRK
jgi:hypothetical protein